MQQLEDVRRMLEALKQLDVSQLEKIDPQHLQTYLGRIIETTERLVVCVDRSLDLGVPLVE